jgi:hypothetical protein
MVPWCRVAVTLGNCAGDDITRRHARAEVGAGRAIVAKRTFGRSMARDRDGQRPGPRMPSPQGRGAHPPAVIASAARMNRAYSTRRVADQRRPASISRIRRPDNGRPNNGASVQKSNTPAA